MPREHLLMPPSLTAWEPFSVDELRARFPRDDVRWWLSGGIALDLFLGYTSRPHGDIDVSVLRGDWPALRAQLAANFEVYVAKDGRLSQLGNREVVPEEHNLWLHERGGDRWRVQVNLELGTRSRWVYRRDQRVARPMSEVALGDDSFRYVNPAVQLLWKAAHPEPKDATDFAVVLPRLEREEREWLAAAIALAHPKSAWNVPDG